MFGPVIRGKMCILRPPRKEDLSTIQKWFEDPEVLQFLPGIGPLSDSGEEEWFKRVGEDPNAVQWVIEVDGRAVGFTGIGGISWRAGKGEKGVGICGKNPPRQGRASQGLGPRATLCLLAVDLY